MYLKEVLTYDYNYAEYIVTDGLNDLCCMCLSVPLPNDIKPYKGMLVDLIYAFCFEDIKIEHINNDKEKNNEIVRLDYFKYIIKGQILDIKKSLVCLGRLIISLENDFKDGFPENFIVGNYIKFKVDRLDCVLK